MANPYAPGGAGESFLTALAAEMWATSNLPPHDFVGQPFGFRSLCGMNPLRLFQRSITHIARSWRVDRVELIVDGAGYQGRLAVVADTGAHGHVACLRKFEQALKWWTPSDVEAAAREGHERS
jgi:hypothetical protein